MVKLETFYRQDVLGGGIMGTEHQRSGENYPNCCQTLIQPQ
jgi:hypothetical protein